MQLNVREVAELSSASNMQECLYGGCGCFVLELPEAGKLCSASIWCKDACVTHAAAFFWVYTVQLVGRGVLQSEKQGQATMQGITIDQARDQSSLFDD